MRDFFEILALLYTGFIVGLIIGAFFIETDATLIGLKNIEHEHTLRKNEILELRRIIETKKLELKKKQMEYLELIKKVGEIR